MCKIKKVMSLLLSVIMIACSVPLSVSADYSDEMDLHGGFQYFSYDRDVIFSEDPAPTLWGLSEKVSNIEVPQDLNGYEYSKVSIEELAALTRIQTKYPDASSFETIMEVIENDQSFLFDATYPDTVASVSEYSYSFINNEVIDFPENLVLMSDIVFAFAPNLREIVIPSGVELSGKFEVAQCSNLERIVISEGVTSESLEISVSNCPKLKEIIVNGSIEYLTSFDVYSCDSIKSIVVGEEVQRASELSLSNETLEELIIHAAEIEDTFLHYCYDTLKIYSVTGADTITWYPDSSALEVFEIGDCVEFLEGSAEFLHDSVWWNSQPDGLVYAGKNCIGYKGEISECDTIVIEEGTKSIGHTAFENLDVSIYVDFPESLELIGNSAFSGTTILGEIVIPENVKKIDYCAFFNATDDLANVHFNGIPEEVTASAFFISSMSDQIVCIDGFCLGYNGTSPEEIIIPEGTVAISNKAFVEYSNIVSVTIPDSVEYIGDKAFYNCSSLINVNIPANVEYIGNYAFYNTDITSADIPSSTKIIGDYAFANCQKLSELNLSDGIESIGDYAFKSCIFTSLVIPSTVTHMGKHMVNSCYKLNTLVLEDGITSVGDYAFKGADATDIVLPEGLKTIGNSSFSHISAADITLPETLESIGKSAFASSELESIALPDSVKTLGDFAFSCCENLSSVDLSSSVSIIPTGCFQSCSALEKIVIPENITIIENMAFYGCENLKYCELPESLTTIGNAVYTACEFLEEINIPKNVSSIGRSLLNGNPYCNVTVDAENTSFKTVDGVLFSADGKELIAYPYTSDAEIYTVPEGTERIYSYAFVNDSVKEIIIPASVKIVEDVAFALCSSLETVRFANADPLMGMWSFSHEESTVKFYGYAGQEAETYAFYNDITFIPLVDKTYTVTFVADGNIVGTSAYVQDSLTVQEPKVPEKNGYVGKWEEYTLDNTDITVNAVYEKINTEDLSYVKTENSAVFDEITNTAKITLKASSAAKVIITKNSKSVPLDIVLVVDQSGSMADKLGTDETKQTALIDAANEFVKTVYADAISKDVEHKIAVVGFGMGNQASGKEYPAYLNTEILSTGGDAVNYNDAKGTDYKNALVSVNDNGAVNPVITSAVASIDAKGATAANLGLAMASNIFSYNSASDRLRVVVFMTDGEPTYMSGYDADVANAAVQQANILKNTYNANVYSVGVLSSEDALDSNVDIFLNYVSSNYLNVESVYDSSQADNEGYYLSVNDTSNLSSAFVDIAIENVTHTAAFDNITITNTISEYFTLTTEQETALRLSLIEKYSIDNSDISIVRNNDGTTTVTIQNLTPYEVENNGVISFEVVVEFEISANGLTAQAGVYNTNTSESGIMIDDSTVYESTFDISDVEILNDRNIVIFNVNGEVFNITSFETDTEITSPEVSFTGTFSGWNIEDGYIPEESVTILNATLTEKERKITWYVNNNSVTETYKVGEFITVPDVSEFTDGLIIKGWTPEIPTVMPDENLSFTALFKAHVHEYIAETVKAVTCTENGIVEYVCSCGDSYAQEIECTGEHNWIAVTGPAAAENVATEEFKCEYCGAAMEKTLNYIITASVSGSNGRYSQVTYELDMTDAQGEYNQPDGTVTISVPVENLFGRVKNVKVYRVADDGTMIELSASYSNGQVTFETDHFSTYVFEAEYETEENTDVDTDTDSNADISTKCSFCDKYEEHKDDAIIGWLYGIIHAVIHFFSTFFNF